MDIHSLAGVGPKTLQKLADLDIHTPSDLLYHFPRKYIDLSHLTQIKFISVGQLVTLTGTLTSFKSIRTRAGRTMQIGKLTDDTGSLAIYWFNQPYLTSVFKESKSYTFAGKISQFNSRPCLVAPFTGDANTGKIIPLYPATSSISTKLIRKLIATNISHILNTYTDPLPAPIVQNYKLFSQQDALNEIHFPHSWENLNLAKYRLALDELLQILTTLHLSTTSLQKISPLLDTSSSSQLISTLYSSLPFVLSLTQHKSLLEIVADLASTSPSSRLLSGDVGSGKTIVALLSLIICLSHQHNGLLIAPTEILTQQHYQNACKLFPQYKKYFSLLTGSTKQLSKEKSTICFSTQAIFYQKKLASHYGLVVFDEQHKYGVRDRSFFENQNITHHTLTMTATPIPRTLALTLLSHIKLSKIKSSPKKQKIKTFVVPVPKRDSCFSWLEKHLIQSKSQAFIVCPKIEPDELNEDSSVQNIHKFVQQKLPQLKVELLHGKQSSTLKQKLMQEFSTGKIDILVSTTVVEVGIDVPNATTMLIFLPENFGLSQLHQLRGRVGRGVKDSYCYLLPSLNCSEEAQRRLLYFSKHHLGYKLAEFDLKNRGSGDLFGLLQHGYPELKLAGFTNKQLLLAAKKIFSSLVNYPKALEKYKLTPDPTVALN